MVAPIIWGALALGGIVATGWTARQVDGATDSTAELVKWAAIGGTVYVSYRALKSAGAI